MPAPAKGTEGKESHKSESNQHPAPNLNDPEGVSVPGCTGPPVQDPHGSPRLGSFTPGGCYFSKGVEWTGLLFSSTFISTSIRTALCSGFHDPNPGDCAIQVQPVGSGFLFFPSRLSSFSCSLPGQASLAQHQGLSLGTLIF